MLPAAKPYTAPTKPAATSTAPVATIAVFVDELNSQIGHGGTEYQLLQLLDWMLDNGYLVLLVTLRQTVPIPLRLQDKHCNHVDLAVTSWFSAKTLRQSRARLLQAGADTRVQATMGFLRDGNLGAWLASRWVFKCPNIATKRYFRFVIDRDNFKERLKESALERVYRNSHTTIVNSDAIAGQLLQRGARRERVHSVANVLPEADAQQMEPQLPVSLLPCERFDVICISNLRAIKDLGTLVRAARQLVLGGRDLRVGIFGEGPERVHLTALISEYDLSDNVFLMGFVADLTSYLRSARVGVLCSLAEGSPNAILEYMDAQLPVVATAAGGTSELIEGQDFGYLFEPGDHSSLAALLEQLLADPKLCREMGSKARSALAKHRPQNVFPQIDSLIRSVVGTDH